MLFLCIMLLFSHWFLQMLLFSCFVFVYWHIVCLFPSFFLASCTVLLICLFFLFLCSHRCCCFVFIYIFLWKGYELSGEIALKNNHYYYYYYCLASIRRFLTSTATATFVSAFVLSRIDYCNSLLFGSTHDVTSHLQRIQNYAARVILRLPMSSSITIHLKSLHWLPVKVRSTYKIAYLCYHCHSSTPPSYVTDMLHKRPLHTSNTRSSSYTMPLLNRPAHSKATLGDRSFSFASSSVWNSILNDVRFAPSLSSFKSRLKTYFFRSVYKDWPVSLITVHMRMTWPC